MPFARARVVAHIGNIEPSNESEMSHSPIVRQHHEVEACNIIVDEIWRNYSPEIEKVGVGFLDFFPNSLENSWFHFVVASYKMLTIELLYTVLARIKLTPIVSHLHSLAVPLGNPKPQR
jgi:hypothetical protein